MVARTVKQYARVGVAALHIEDQVQTKRCGHLLGKQVVSREEFLTRVRAAVLARDLIPGDSDFVRDCILIYATLCAEELPNQSGHYRENRLGPGIRYGRGCIAFEAGSRRGGRCLLHRRRPYEGTS